MSCDLKERHPLLMVPHVFTMSVVVYTNGEPFHFPVEKVREALVAALLPGTGVGSVTCTNHGVYTGPQGAAS